MNTGRGGARDPSGPGQDSLAVIFDAYWWRRGPLSNRQVMRGLVEAWLEAYPGDRVTLAVRAADASAVRDEVPPSVGLLPLRFGVHGAAVALELPVRVLRARDPGVVVAQNFTPLWGPAVTFVHDVLFQERPGWFTWTERAYLAPIPLLARRARAVFTSSVTESRRIRRLNPALRVVRPIGLAVADDLVRAVPRRPRLPESLDLSRGFFLTVQRLNIRKNLAVLLRACDGPSLRRLGMPVLVVGNASGRAERRSPSTRSLERDGLLHFTGLVTTPELKWLYQHTSAFVFPSLDEGFGLPPVEAASLGAPVLVADRPVFRETLGGEATFFDPLDATQLAGLMAEAARQRRPTHVVSGATWQDCVRALREGILEHALGRPDVAVPSSEPPRLSASTPREPERPRERARVRMRRPS